MKWYCKKYEDLTLDEFHNLLQLRINVFVVEQNCPYPELDDKDQQAWHVFAVNDEGITVAVTRILAPGVSYKEASIGRVVTHDSTRGSGLGKELMEKSIQYVYDMFGEVPVRISAQQYLLNFYNSLGFEQVSEMYLEDGIPHVEMLKK